MFSFKVLCTLSFLQVTSNYGSYCTKFHRDKLLSNTIILVDFHSVFSLLQNRTTETCLIHLRPTMFAAQNGRAGSNNKKQELSIPQLVGTVWEACSALKKTPATNITAIGRAMTQVAVSMKDVLREMNELKPASSDIGDESSVQESAEGESKSQDSDDSFAGDLGNDLSPEEMKIARLTTDVVSAILVVTKELIRSITSLLKQESSADIATFVPSLETLLKLTQEIGLQIDELGASLYPPQEISTLKAAIEKISCTTDEIFVELEKLKGCSEDFVKACNGLRSSLKQLEAELDQSDGTDTMPKIENLIIT